MPAVLPFTDDARANRLLATDPLALLLGMMLDQQVPMERAFRSPYDLKERMGGTLRAAAIAVMDPDQLVALFRRPPALHRYPRSMAGRAQELCRHLVEHYGGRAERVWKDAPSGAELLARLRALPGFGEQKGRIFVALLAKRVGVAPPGWEEAAGAYGPPGYFSVADIDGPDALARVREHKRAVKAQARAAGSGVKARVAGSGVKARVAGSGVKARAAGSGVKARAAGSGVKARAAGSGVKARAAGPDPRSASRAPGRGTSRRRAQENRES